MLNSNQAKLDNVQISGRYSNHRQYQSKAASSIARIFQSFFSWQVSDGSFLNKIRRLHELHGQEPTEGFHELYKSLGQVYGFGRLGKFDFLTMLGKLQLAPIVPGSVYLVGATGPASGAKLLFFGNK